MYGLMISHNRVVYQLLLALCCIGVVVGKNVYDYRDYIDELEIPCTVFRPHTTE